MGIEVVVGVVILGALSYFVYTRVRKANNKRSGPGGFRRDVKEREDLK